MESDGKNGNFLNKAFCYAASEEIGFSTLKCTRCVPAIFLIKMKALCSFQNPLVNGKKYSRSYNTASRLGSKNCTLSGKF